MRPQPPFARAVRRFLMIAMLAPVWGPLVAQTRAPADPLTGVWYGYIGPSAANQTAVKVDIKMTAAGAITGTVTGPRITPGDIKTGTFDRATGALTFTVVVRDQPGEAGGSVYFTGRLARDTIAGTMKMGEENGVFRFTKDGDWMRDARPVPKAALGDAAAAVRRSFVEVSDWMVRAAELVPADKYAYRPTSTVRTFGQLVGHVVDGARFYCGRAKGGTAAWTDSTERGVTAKAALVEALKMAVGNCMAAYEGGGAVGPSWTTWGTPACTTGTW